MKFKVFLLSILTSLFIQYPTVVLAQDNTTARMCSAVFYYLNHRIPMDLQKVRQSYDQGISIDKVTDANWAYSENAKVPSFREYIEVAFEQDPTLKETVGIYYELQKRSQSVRYRRFWNGYKKALMPMTSQMKSKLDQANASNLILDYVEWNIKNAEQNLKSISPAHLREAAVIYVLAEIKLTIHQHEKPYPVVQRIVDQIYQKTHAKKNGFLYKLVEQSKDFEYRRDAYLKDLSDLWEKEHELLWQDLKKEIGSDLDGDHYLAMIIGYALKKSHNYKLFEANLTHAQSLEKMEALYRYYYQEIPSILRSTEDPSEDFEPL